MIILTREIALLTSNIFFLPIVYPFFTDSEASREEAKVFLRSTRIREAGDTPTRQEKEGYGQDHLNHCTFVDTGTTFYAIQPNSHPPQDLIKLKYNPTKINKKKSERGEKRQKTRPSQPEKKYKEKEVQRRRQERRPTRYRQPHHHLFFFCSFFLPPASYISRVSRFIKRTLAEKHRH